MGGVYEMSRLSHFSQSCEIGRQPKMILRIIS